MLRYTIQFGIITC